MGMTFKEVVAGIYAAGASLSVTENGKLKVEGAGLLTPEFVDAITAHKDQLLQMLTGDPLSGPGWEGRTALYRQALRWLDERTPEEAKENVTAALCRQEVVDRFNEVWCDGSFEEFRAALKEHIRAGLRATTETV